jgi:hypothetical protein
MSIHVLSPMHSITKKSKVHRSVHKNLLKSYVSTCQAVPKLPHLINIKSVHYCFLDSSLIFFQLCVNYDWLFPLYVSLLLHFSNFLSLLSFLFCFHVSIMDQDASPKNLLWFFFLLNKTYYGSLCNKRGPTGPTLAVTFFLFLKYSVFP